MQVRNGHSHSSRLQTPILSWWDKREKSNKTEVSNGPGTQMKAEGASDSYGTRQEAANMYVKHVEMRANSGAGRQILNRVWA